MAEAVNRMLPGGMVVLCGGRHPVDTVVTIPPDILMEWQARELGRPVQGSDRVPAMYGCATCFGVPGDEPLQQRAFQQKVRNYLGLVGVKGGEA